ncbi:hypothetical protein CSUI_005806, partial [Cystoisospora suis]
RRLSSKRSSYSELAQTYEFTERID